MRATFTRLELHVPTAVRALTGKETVGPQPVDADAGWVPAAAAAADAAPAAAQAGRAGAGLGPGHALLAAARPRPGAAPDPPRSDIGWLSVTPRSRFVTVVGTGGGGQDPQAVAVSQSARTASVAAEIP